MARDCVFCEIAAGEEPTQLIFQWPDAVVFEPLNPIVPGHLLVIPRAHVWSFLDDPIVSGTVMARASDFASRLPGQFNLITSAGDAATQTVLHLHLHLIPREPGDKISLPWDVRND